MCYFSFLLEPFFYTLILTALYTLIAKLGYSRSAELIYSSLQSVFGRGEYRKFMASWRELKGAKLEVTKVSAQVIRDLYLSGYNAVINLGRVR